MILSSTMLLRRVKDYGTGVNTAYLIRHSWSLVGVEDVHDTLGGSHRNGALLHNNLVTRSNSCDEPCCTLHVLQIRRSTLHQHNTCYVNKQLL